MNALSQLEDQVKENNYHEIVNSLAVSQSHCVFMRLNHVVQAVKQIGTSFKPYTSIQRISQIWRRIQEIQVEIKSRIDADWDKLYAHMDVLADYTLTIASSHQQLRTGPVEAHQAFCDR